MMQQQPEFGQCSELTCTETAVRLFDCAHHCMKKVCLQHLIEHDRMIEHNQDHGQRIRTDLLQLWSTYTSFLDETKIRFEFEQKLRKHQQLIREISNLFEINSNNIEQYRAMIEKLKQNIEQERQTNQPTIESYPSIDQVKIEPTEFISTTDEHDSLNISLATRVEQRESISTSYSSMIDDYDHDMEDTSQHTDEENSPNQTINRPSIGKLSGECPLWFDGAYGLTEESHGLYICPRRRHKELHRHLVRFHKLSTPTISKICEAIKTNEDPFRKALFAPTDTVLDQINQILCPFSIYNDHSTDIPNSTERACRCAKPQLPYTLCNHLIRDHRMPKSNAEELVEQLKK